MSRFSSRTVMPEKMDQPGIPESEIHKALHELEVINTYLGGYSVTLNALEKLTTGMSAISVVDFGSGGGDVLRNVAKLFRRKKIQASLTGIDINPVMTKYSSTRSTRFPEIKYSTMSVWGEEVASLRPHVVINSLFCHHFDRDTLISLVERMYSVASKSVIINDIHRHPVAYYLIKFITAIFSRSSLVRDDAPVSVLNSFTRSEWTDVLTTAGITDFSIHWKWAWRWQIIIRKS